MSTDAQSHNPRAGVWITAYSASSVFGSTMEALSAGLAAGKSGLSTNPSLPDTFGSLPFSACLGLVPSRLDSAPTRAPFPDTRQLRMAWNVVKQIESELRSTIAHFGPDRVGIVLGTSTGGILSTEEALLHYRSHGTLPSNYSCIDGHAMDAVVRYLVQALELRGPAFATSSACASGAKALASAKRMIELGLVDAVLAGGIDSIARMTIFGFHSLGVLSENNCRPFDDSSYGMNVAEGGSWLLLQKSDVDSPLSPLASLLGVGESSDAHHLSAPDPTGQSQARAMRRALTDAGLSAEDISYINAHGTGTKANDTAERATITEIFGDCPASSTKGLIGHQLGAAGATEALIAIEVARGLGLGKNGAVNPERFPLELPQGDVQVLSNSFAFGGANITLALSSGSSVTKAADKSAGLRARIARASALSLHPEYDSLCFPTRSDRVVDPKKIGSTLLGSRGRARASELTRLFAEGISWLGLSPEELSDIPLFVGSVLGQVQTSKGLIELFLDNDASPLAFQGSVHNATAGVLSIALSNQKPSSSIAAGADTLFATTLEAMTYLDRRTCPRVLVLVGDERAPEVLGLPDFESAVTVLLLEHPDCETDVHPSQQFLEIRPSTVTANTLPTIETPPALRSHICGEGLGLVNWLVSSTAPSLARVRRADHDSPWSLVVTRKDDTGDDIASCSVADLVPHEAPLLLLSQVIHFDDEGIVCLVDDQANEMFADEEGIDTVVSTEWMAQAVGAYVGAKKRASGHPPRIGFIIGARKVDFHVSKVKEGTPLHVTAKPVWIDQASGSFRCTVKDISTDKIIAEGSLTVHEPAK